MNELMPAALQAVKEMNGFCGKSIMVERIASNGTVLEMDLVLRELPHEGQEILFDQEEEA